MPSHVSTGVPGQGSVIRTFHTDSGWGGPIFAGHFPLRVSQVDPTVRTGSHSGHGSGLSFSIQKALPGTLGASPQWLPCPCLCQPFSAHLLLPWFSVPLHLGLPTPLPPHPCSLSPSTWVWPHCDGARCDVFYFLSPPRTRGIL